MQVRWQTKGVPMDTLPQKSSSELSPENAPSVEIDRQLVSHVDHFLRLKCPELRLRHDQFNVQIQTLASVQSIMISLLLCSIPLGAENYVRFQIAETVHDFVSCAVVCTLILGTNLAAIGTYVTSKSVMKENLGELTDDAKRRIQWVQSGIFSAWVLHQMFRLFARVLNGPCADDASSDEMWNCNPNASVKQIPAAPAAMLMVLPLYYAVCVRGGHYGLSLSLWAMGMLSMGCAAVYASATASTMTICLYGIFSLAIIVEMRRLNLFRFLTHLKLEEMLAEKARADDEANAQEMRSMIANVAHDLKTPLTSFLTGVEFISEVVRDLKALASTMELHQSLYAMANSKLHECVSSLESCVTDMRNTNAFMLMTINRCIDYTKTTKGLKLLPKLETVRLLDALQMPFKCMKDVQRRVGLLLAPLATGICSHVITDGQWLQENLLCLLSNAVKYSDGGTVLVRVTQVTRVSMPTIEDPELDRPIAAKNALSLALRLTQSSSSSVYFKSTSRSGKVYGVDDSSSYAGSRSGDGINEMLSFEVEDHGIGLSEEATANLFNPFKQAQRLAGGTGLGLFSLAKRIEALGGRCGVRRRPDGHEGSIFWFEIPYRPDTQAAELDGGMDTEPLVGASPVHSPTRSPAPSPKASGVGSVQSLPRAAITSPTADSRRAQGARFSAHLDILVVDDAPSILKMTSMMLRRHQHSVLTATNGADAVKVVAERVQRTGRGFDVVLMDLQMPVMDGLEATRRLRAMESSASTSLEAPHFVIIGFSANSDAETAAEAQMAGVDSFIPKPFTLEAFYREYQTVVNTH